MLEASVRRPVRPLFTNVPLSRHKGLIARRLESFGKGDAGIVQIALIRRRSEIVDHVTDAGAMVIETGQQRRTRWAAARTVVELRETNAFLRQFIDVGRIDFAAITTDVREAHVIGKDDNQIGPLRFGS